MKQVLQRKIWKLPVWAWLGLFFAFLIAANLPKGEDDRVNRGSVPEVDSDADGLRSTEPDVAKNEDAESDPADATAQTYEYEMLSQRDVSYAGVRRYSDHIVIADDQVDRDRLIATLSKHVERYRGDANAVGVIVHGDPREELGGQGAWGTWDWAPDGEWGKAGEGDPETWSGYEWSAASEPGKLDDPTNCVRPTDEAYDVSEAYDKLRAEQPDAEEATLVDVVAAQTGLSSSAVNELRISVIAWLFC